MLPCTYADTGTDESTPPVSGNFINRSSRLGKSRSQFREPILHYGRCRNQESPDGFFFVGVVSALPDSRFSAKSVIHRWIGFGLENWVIITIGRRV